MRRSSSTPPANLTNVRETRRSFRSVWRGLPGRTPPHTVVGGGNMYFFKNASPAERGRVCDSPAGSASRSGPPIGRSAPAISPPAPAAYETQVLKDFIAKVPEANVARTFLPVATGELSVHENQRVYKVLTDNIQACLSGSKPPAQAMADAQAKPTAS